LDQFCFSGGAAIHAEGREGRSGTTAERADKVGVRRPETLPVGLLFANQQSDNPAGRTYPVSRETGLDRWAGLVWAKSFGLWLGRTTSVTVAEALDLAPNHHRQNDSI
jgi:hypothetical protein